MTTTATTFEEFAAANGWGPESKYHDAARVLWDMEQKAQASYPDTIPPCPSWCGLPAGHEYDSYMPDGKNGVVHTRCHERSFGSVELVGFENYEGGEVEILGPTIDCQQTAREDLSAEQARRIAADLLAAAAVLDEITGQ